MQSASRSQAPVAERSTAVATVLGLLLPGGGHLYLGRVGLAALGFVVLGGMYYLGVVLSDGMFLEYLPPEMRGAMAWLLAPELGNFSFLYWHQGAYGFGQLEPRTWPEGIHLGTTLTALSGVLNLLLASHANYLARCTRLGEPRSPGGLDPAASATASFLVPGLGQFLQGRRLRGGVIFVLLVGLFLVSTALAGGTNLDRERHFYYWAGQFLLGLPAILTELVNGHPVQLEVVPYADGGVVLASIAGLLNVLGMMDAYAFADERVFPESYASTAEGEGARGEAAA